MQSVRPAKRRRTSGYISPPSGDEYAIDQQHSKDDSCTRLTRAINVLKVEAEALASIAALYETDPTARTALSSAVDAILTAQEQRGKLIICGVGKSAYIGMKLQATCKSLGISASFMHATEAAHGDLGDVKPWDVLLFVSFSGRTPELLNVLPHIPDATRTIAMSSHRDERECQLLRGRKGAILLPTPIHEREENSFGVGAPTTSTTVALAVADMLALTTADEIHAGKTGDVFKRNHPGGAIGLTHREAESLKSTMIDAAPVELLSPSTSDVSEG
ncbi:sugar isomerase [Lecanosticta acicola]|uniref:Sugar isomerase n=1 Tax=Lecanosticta acicola TaxID=111012 RepID=A0AAI9EEW3_9PEZI|nr:sugar isomerase [Lecanosticta acicola]